MKLVGALIIVLCLAAILFLVANIYVNIKGNIKICIPIWIDIYLVYTAMQEGEFINHELHIFTAKP